MYLKAYIQLTCAVSILTSPASSSLDVDSLLELMTLTEQTCGGIHWCTVQSPVTMETKMAACCPRCSCGRNCTTSGPCCPDIMLRDYLDGQVFPNSMELAAVLNQTITSDFEADMHTSDDGKEKDGECIKSRLFQKSLTIPNSFMYIMVSKCTNLSVSPDARTKCESPAIVDPDKTDITELLPLQSTSTGVVYRNKYCMQCALPDAGPFVDWNAWIATDLVPLEFQSYHFSTMHDVVRFIFQQDQLHGTYDIFFEPSKESKERFPPKMCQVFDVHACKNGTIASQAAIYACERYVFPVYGVEAGNVTLFKNMACLTCTDYRLADDGACTSNYNRRASPTFKGWLERLHIARAMGKIPAASDLQKVFGPKCKPGHMYDSKRSVCRKIYCPCMMVLHDSTCVSIFEEIIYNNFFLVHIDLVYRASAKHQRNESEYHSAIFEYFKRVFENSDEFQTDHITLSVTTGDEPSPRRYFVFIAFTGANDHIFFPGVIAFISKHFRGIKRIENEDFRIRMDVTDAMNVSKHGITNINTGQRYEVALTTFDISSFQDHVLVERSILQVSECHFCHRIELLQDEMDKNGCAVYVKPSKTIERRFSTFVSNDSKILVCAAKVITEVDVDSEKETKSVDEKDSNLIPITEAEAGLPLSAVDIVGLSVFAATLGLLLMTVCVTVTVEIFRKRGSVPQQNDQSSPTGQV